MDVECRFMIKGEGTLHQIFWCRVVENLYIKLFLVLSCSLNPTSCTPSRPFMVAIIFGLLISLTLQVFSFLWPSSVVEALCDSYHRHALAWLRKVVASYCPNTRYRKYLHSSDSGAVMNKANFIVKYITTVQKKFTIPLKESWHSHSTLFSGII